LVIGDFIVYILLLLAIMLKSGLVADTQKNY